MTQQPPQPDSSFGLLSYLRIPDTYHFVTLHSAAGYVELVRFVHDEVVTIPNKKRKIVGDMLIVNEGEYYTLTLNWQNFPQNFATASAFIYDKEDGEGCEIQGYAELTNAIPMFGFIMLVVAMIAFVATSIGPVVFLIWLVLYVLATRGALRWRDALVQHLVHLAQVIPHHHDSFVEEEFDERIDLLVTGIKQGK